MGEELLTMGNIQFYFYQGAIVLSLIGLYIVITTDNLIKKIIGLSLFQGAVFVHLIMLAYIQGAGPPNLRGEGLLVNPLPHVLVLTAIVVAIATTALALALIVQTYHHWGSIDEGDISQ